VFVPRGDALDQYILDDPDYLLSDDVEDAVVDLTNDAVYARHVLCAAAERPLTESDVEWFGPRDRLERAVTTWRDAGQLVGDVDRGAQYDGPPRPQSTISMYASTDERYEVRCTNGDIDMEPLGKERVYRDYHPGALALYDGQQYEVTDVLEERPQPVVEVRAVGTREYTQTMSDKRVHDVVSERSTDLGGGFALHAGEGTVEVHYHS
jgi:DEAD/DEAH box helicase domain-containing protein